MFANVNCRTGEVEHEYRCVGVDGCWVRIVSVLPVSAKQGKGRHANGSRVDGEETGVGGSKTGGEEESKRGTGQDGRASKTRGEEETVVESLAGEKRAVLVEFLKTGII